MYNRNPSPDYASTTESNEPQPAPRKLGGVRKTVGNPEHVADKREFDIPDFDFGVTQSLTPGPSRPGTAAGRVSPLENSFRSTPPTPNEERKPQLERISPGRTNSANVSPLPSPSPHSRPSSRQMWYPGLAGGRQSPGGLTAEEFVQQRASIARLPGGYVPRRTTSNSRAEDMMTPPPEQPERKKLQKRNTSRPTSRGSLMDFSGNLSAREQEHVARMTGSSLLTLSDRSQMPDPNVGLIGAISAREQDRRNMKEGISSHLAQAAIAQRQQQAQSAYMHQVQAQYRPGMNAWSQQQQTAYVQPGYYPPQQLQQQQYYPQQPQQNPYAQQQYPQGSQIYREYYAPQGGYRQQ